VVPPDPPGHVPEAQVSGGLSRRMAVAAGPALMPNADRSASRCGPGTASSRSSIGAHSWCSPAKASSISDWTPPARSMRQPGALLARYSSSASCPHPARLAPPAAGSRRRGRPPPAGRGPGARRRGRSAPPRGTPPADSPCDGWTVAVARASRQAGPLSSRPAAVVAPCQPQSRATGQRVSRRARASRWGAAMAANRYRESPGGQEPGRGLAATTAWDATAMLARNAQ
jgi:hypothetical protein